MATLDTVKEVLESNLDIDPENVTEDATFEDLGIDSLDTVEILMDLEEELGTQLVLDECHKQIVALHLNQKTRSDPNKFKELLQNQMRLKIAYGQMDDGKDEYTSKNYERKLFIK